MLAVRRSKRYTDTLTGAFVAVTVVVDPLRQG